MRCDDIRRLFPEYLIDELPEHERRAIRDHLSGCADCRSHLERMEEVLGLISSGDGTTASDSYFARFPGRVMERIGTPGSRRITTRRHVRLRSALVLSGTVAAAVALFLMIIRPDAPLFGPGPSAYHYTPTEVAVIDVPPVDESLVQEFDALTVSEMGTVDLLLDADPWEELPDLSDEEMERLHPEILI